MLPNARFTGTVARRTVASKIFADIHIAPSHRGYPHPVWVDSFSLIADLLLGCGVGRYLGAMQGPAFQQEVAVRGFSAGSYCGLSLLHILWPIPGVVTKGCLGAIACPPAMLGMSQAKAEDRLHLIHYESDELCCWKPGTPQLVQISSTYTYVMNESSAYKDHFGPSEHGYSHWLALDLPTGTIQLRTLLFLRPEAAAKAKRDATPLRLRCKLNPQAMLHLSTWEETEGGTRVTRSDLGAVQIKVNTRDQICSETELRDRLIDLVSVGNLRHRPEALFALFRQSVQAAWAGEEKTLWSCHHIRHLHTLDDVNRTPRSRSHTYSHLMITFTTYEFSGRVIPSCCSLILRWWMHILLTGSAARLAM